MNIVILTGAGISKESGIPTFRDAGGLWNNFNVAKLATADAMANNREEVLRFYNTRKQEAKKSIPNATHFALAELQMHHNVTIITQNVDDLHERAGSEVLHMHGNLFWKRCTSCHDYSECYEEINIDDRCVKCGNNTLRPHVVCFGEYPLFEEQINNAISSCDLFVSIGTSGEVYPAAAFVDIMNDANIETIEINKQKTVLSSKFKVGIYGDATEVVPSWVRSIIGDKDDIK